MDAATLEHVISQVGRVLDAEVIFENRKREMGLDGLKARLAHITGIDALKAQVNSDRTETYTLGDQTVEVPAGNAAKRARVHMLAEGLRSEALAKVDEAVAAISEQPAAELPKPSRDRSMSITGAANLAGTIKDRINAAKNRIAQVSANTDGALAKLNDAADTGDKIATQIEAEASDLLAQIGQFSNGGPE